MCHLLRFTDPSPEHISGLEALYRELSPDTNPVIDHALLTRVCRENVAYIATHTSTGELVAFALLVPGHKPTGSYAQIHDVIVMEKHRGRQPGRDQSIAEEIIGNLIDEARGLGINYIELTSKPERIAANYLYRKLGFVMIAEGKTNLYRLYL